MTLVNSFRSRSVRIASLIPFLCAFAILAFFRHPTRILPPKWFLRPTSTPAPPSGLGEQDARCSTFPDPGNLAIAVKTGATEAVEKIPTLMRTALRCAESVMIFSDLEQIIAGYQLHDALEDIPRAAMDGNSDFDFYEKLQEAKKYGQIEAMLKGLHDPRVSQDLASWTLDKYKQLHILEKLYEAHPDKDWYLLLDADTYVVWPNLLAWLDQLPDPTLTELYLGSPANVGDVQFAHGGSGILLSQTTMYDFAVTNKGIASSWDKPMHDECCGDLIIGTVLKNNGILLRPSWPTVNGEKPITLPFGPTHWCQPVVTMHHVGPNEMSQITNFELSKLATNDTEGPLTFAQLFNAFTRDILPGTLEQWDNVCLDVTTEADSYESCQRICEEDMDCFQFNHHGNQCALGHSIHLGNVKNSEDGTTFRSGWLNDRITKWVESQPPCRPKFPWTGETD